jgi:hypothetical protein
MSQANLEFHHLDAEMWFVKRLRELGRNVFSGDTTPEIRKERIREAIIEGNLDLAIIGKGRGGKPETFEDCFVRLFNEPLFTTKSSRKTG